MKTNISNLNFFISASSTLARQKSGIIQDISGILKKIGYKETLNWYESSEIHDKEIYDKSIESIKKSDLVIAEITYPSIGVGQQITLATNWHIPVLCLYDENISDPQKQSQFTFNMDKDNNIKIISYNSKNLEDILSREVTKISSKQFAKFNFISTPQINNFLEIESKNKNYQNLNSLERLLRTG
jgi:hypothetical protein